MGLALLVLSVVVVLDKHARGKTVWGVATIGISMAGYAILVVVAAMNNLSPAPWAQILIAILYLPALLLGVVGGFLENRLVPMPEGIPIPTGPVA